MKGVNLVIPIILSFCFCFSFSLGIDYNKFQWIPKREIESHLEMLGDRILGEEDGERLLYCRARFGSHFYPGKFYFPGDKRGCVISGSRKEWDLSSFEYEVLYIPLAAVRWVPGNGTIPEYALAVGTDENRGTYNYLGRVSLSSGKQILGRIVGRSFYYPFEDKERESRDYEVLTLTFQGRRRVNLVAAL